MAWRAGAVRRRCGRSARPWRRRGGPCLGASPPRPTPRGWPAGPSPPWRPGARLREVGTTNKTRLSDYEGAIGPATAALLRVHPSNYRIVGFTEAVGIADLAALARSRGLWTIDDIGSGALGPGRPPHVAGEPTASEGLAGGADLVLASGDKLLGGPQCGLMIGSRAAIDQVTSDPLMRALRVDKMTLAALEATLRLALDPALGG